MSKNTIYAGFIVTCEHGGNQVPSEYAHLFVGHEELLRSHRGWDPGALECARELAVYLDAPIFFSEVTRLLVELNRSVRHPSLFSSISKGLSREEKERILDLYYRPHWEAVEREARAILDKGLAVIHIAVHSFTPVLSGQVRRADIGLLYDPGRTRERSFCAKWRRAFLLRAPGLRVRMNYPYRGVANSLPTALRKRLPEGYLGIEIEISQGFLLGDPGVWENVRRTVEATVPASF